MKEDSSFDLMVVYGVCGECGRSLMVTGPRLARLDLAGLVPDGGVPVEADAEGFFRCPVCGTRNRVRNWPGQRSAEDQVQGLDHLETDPVEDGDVIASEDDVLF